MRLSETPVIKTRFLAYDMEMTGLDPWDDNIVEIACVQIDGLTIREEHGFFVQLNPQTGFDPMASDITGLSHNRNDFYENPQIESVLPEFLGQAQERILVGQNPRLDLEFLRTAGKSAAMMIPNYPIIDISRLFIRAFPGEDRFNLDHIARRLNLRPRRGQHNAWEDTILTAHCFVRLAGIFRKKGMTTAGDLMKAGRMR